MPLLTCPNDNAPMQALVRQGVELDICPTCRGVWLDRGELEKLMGMVRADDEGRPPVAAALDEQHRPPRAEPPYESRPEYGGRERGERGEYGERGGYDVSGQRRKKRFDVFDIFD